MPRPRFFKLEPERRQRILDAAAEALVAHGYEGVSLNQIIEQAGISKGAVYYYFDDKTDLFATVLRRATEVLLEGVEIDLDRLDRDTFWPRLEAAFAATVANAASHPWRAGVGRLFYAPPVGAAIDEVVRRELARAVDWLGAVVRRGRELGTVRRDLPEPLVVAMAAGAGEASDRWLANHWNQVAPDRLDATWSGVFSALRRLVEPPGSAE